MITSPTLVAEARQVARVAAAVPRWLASVPLYRRRAPERRCQGQGEDFMRCFRSLPIITKREIRQEFPRNFLPAGVELQSLLERDLVELERTSGTAEEATPLLLARGWWQAQEQAALRLNALVARHLTPTTRRVTIVSPVCSSEICYTGTPAWSERIVGDSLFVNLSRYPFLWSEPTLARMAQETLDWQPVFLDMDPVYGVVFARYCERHGLRLPSLKFVLCSYEFLSVAHRAILQRVFHVPVFNLYGATETGHLLMENEQGEMVPSLETAFLELVAPDATGIGDLVVTTLNNHYMPLIRYGIGDLARRHVQPYHTAFELHGRARDALLSTRGQRVTVAQIDQCFAGLAGIVHYQLRQDAPREFTLFYVAESERMTTDTMAALRSRLGELLGTRYLQLRSVDYIPCESSGKFTLCQPLVSQAAADE